MAEKQSFAELVDSVRRDPNFKPYKLPTNITTKPHKLESPDSHREDAE